MTRARRPSSLLLIGTGMLASAGQSAQALVVPDAGAGDDAGATAADDPLASLAQSSAPPARAEKLNPTGRAISLTVPAKDGPTYLGDIPLTIGADDSLQFPADRVLQLLTPLITPDVGDTLRTALSGKSSVGPSDFAAAGIRVDYNPRTLELGFVIPPEIRASRSLSVSALDRQMVGDVLKPEKFSAYLNIRGSLDLVEDGFDKGFQNPLFLLDGAARIGDLVAESDAIWSPGADGADFQRLGSRLVYDDLKNIMRISAGDLRSQGRGFQTAPDIAGLSLVRSYSVLNPQQIIRPRGDRSFRLERPSTVEVIVNGQQVRRLTLAAGNYNLRDFPFAQGGNDIRLNVLDDTGRTEVLRFNLFVDQTQLAKGLTEFGVYAGVKAPLGLRGPDYSDDFVFSGFVRHGLSEFATVGANFQADKLTKMGGLEGVFASEIGTFGLNTAVSDTKGLGTGVAAQGTYQYLIQHPDGQSDSFNLFAEHRSGKFTPAGNGILNIPFRLEIGGGYSHAFGPDFYAGIDARYSKGRAGIDDVHSYRLNSGYRINQNMTLTAEARYEEDSRGKEVSGFLTLTMRLGRASTVRGEFDTRNNRARASYQTLKGTGVGAYNFTADVERSDLGAATSINANYFTNRAELGFSHFGTYSNGFGDSLSQRSSFRVGTSIAIAGDQLSIGRPIYDSFAIVKPHKGIAGSDVVVEPTPFGLTAITGKMGTATMPGLSSYAERTVTLDVANAPAGTDIGQGSFKVFPSYRSGYVVEVGSDYNVTIFGTMLNADGEAVALVAGKATQLAKPDREPVTLFTNRQGRFGATGLAPGKWRIEMLDAEKSVFDIEISEDAKGIVRLGDITPVKGQ